MGKNRDWAWDWGVEGVLSGVSGHTTGWPEGIGG